MKTYEEACNCKVQFTDSSFQTSQRAGQPVQGGDLGDAKFDAP
jgi:hypothetical protein